MKLHHYMNTVRANPDVPWTVPNLCKAYNWPTNLAGGGTIAIIELGGGWLLRDLQIFCSRTRQPVPTVIDVSVDGTRNDPGKSDADGEVALDIQVAATAYFMATGKAAKIVVFWAQDIAAAVRAATAYGCDTCSISWGAAEREWGIIAAHDMEAAAMAAVSAGMTVFAAAGDNDSSDGERTVANVDLPASAPHVVACGGTNKKVLSETVWNNNPGNPMGFGTGGGFSSYFPRPSWQTHTNPTSSKRMIPDMSANADPNTGYIIVVAGQEQVVGGTSAVAPLFAGLFAAFGTKKGFVTPRLWQNPANFVDITVGNNGLYHSTTGSDPCSGMGRPIGTKMATLFG